jgi:hypothetical protein
MSFDTDPKDRYERILWYHPESDCYGECGSRAEWEAYNDSGELDDVTGVSHHEDEFKKRTKGSASNV